MPNIPPILISGFAGVGKSTLAKKIAKKFGLRYICGGDVLKEIAKEQGYAPRDNWWETEEGMKFLKKRMENHEYDEKVDAKMIEHARKGNCVITSWTLPWIYREKAIKIWLHANRKERAKRIARRDNISIDEAYEIVKKRDEENVKLYKKLYGYELGKDLEVFDLIVDTNGKTEEEVWQEVLEFLKKKLKIKNKRSA